MNVKTKAHIAVLAANLIYGINFSIMQYVTDNLMQPIALNVLRIGGAALLFWSLYLFKLGSLRIARKDWLRLILCALTGVVINQLLFVKGVSLTTTTRAALLMLITPIAVVFIAAALLHEKIQLHKLIGLLLGVCGAVLLISIKETTRIGNNILLGDTLVIINAISYAFYLVLVKPLMQHYSAINIMRWLFTIALFIVLPLGIQPIANINWRIFSGSDYAVVAFIIVAVTFCTFLFNIYGVKILGSTVTGAYIYSQPLFAAFVAIVYSRDSTNWGIKALAALLIFVGVYLVSFYQKNLTTSHQNNNVNNNSTS